MRRRGLNKFASCHMSLGSMNTTWTRFQTSYIKNGQKWKTLAKLWLYISRLSSLLNCVALRVQHLPKALSSILENIGIFATHLVWLFNSVSLYSYLRNARPFCVCASVWCARVWCKHLFLEKCQAWLLFHLHASPGSPLFSLATFADLDGLLHWLHNRNGLGFCR